jgi:ElaA protein
MEGSEKLNPSWTIKRFEALSLLELHDLLRLRTDIFVVEQNCAYPEIDGKDPYCFHCIGKTEEDLLIATARIAPAGLIYPEWSIGRVVVNDSYRKSGVGHQLMETCIAFCKSTAKAPSVKIAAQLYLEKFYSDLGFKRISDVYPWDGIDHIDMRLSFG